MMFIHEFGVLLEYQREFVPSSKKFNLGHVENSYRTKNIFYSSVELRYLYNKKLEDKWN